MVLGVNPEGEADANTQQNGESHGGGRTKVRRSRVDTIAQRSVATRVHPYEERFPDRMVGLKRTCIHFTVGNRWRLSKTIRAGASIEGRVRKNEYASHTTVGADGKIVFRCGKTAECTRIPGVPFAVRGSFSVSIDYNSTHSLRNVPVSLFQSTRRTSRLSIFHYFVHLLCVTLSPVGPALSAVI
jgi:hypothetical protein